MSEKKQQQMSQAVIDTVVVQRVAALAATGATTREIAEQSGMSNYLVKKVMAHPGFKPALQAIADEACNNAKQSLRSEFSRMSKEVIRVMYANLEKNNLEAVKVFCKVLGFEEAEQKTGDTNIQVVLPGMGGGTKPKEQAEAYELPESAYQEADFETEKEDPQGAGL